MTRHDITHDARNDYARHDAGQPYTKSILLLRRFLLAVIFGKIIEADLE